MDPLIAAVLRIASRRLADWWLEKRPLSKESRIARKQKRALNKTLKKQGLSRKERKMELLAKLLAYSATKRTSTKAGVVGLVPLVALAAPFLPFYDSLNSMLLEACKSGDGPAVALATGALVWVTTVLAARWSKTPTTIGKL